MISREQLYELVWSKPMTKVAAQFEVSGSYMARICSVLNVPRPERGYWAKLAVGKAPARQRLPEPGPGDQLFWSRDGETSPPIKPRSPPARPRAARIVIAKDTIHGLVRGAKHHFETGRPVEEDAYLKPYKKLLVDVTASKSGLDKALDFANQLFNTFESVGHRVMLAPPNEQLRRGEIDEREKTPKRPDYGYRSQWSPWRPTVVYVGTVAIGLAILEMSEDVLLRFVGGKYIRDADYKPPKTSRFYVDHTWTTTRALPSGRLRLIAYSPYWRVSWSTQWQETTDVPLTKSLAAIVKEIEGSVANLVAKLEEADRLAEIARLQRLAEEEKCRRQEDKRRVAESRRQSSEHLQQIIQKWSNVMSIEQFLKGIEQRASDLSAEDQVKLRQRLELAREFLGAQDPLDFFLWWKTPLERYRPIYDSTDTVLPDEPNDGEEA